MSYLKLPRTRLILALFAISSLSLVLFPDVDLRVSSFFFGGHGFDLAASWWAMALHESVAFFICAALVTVLGIYCFNRRASRNVCGVDGRVVCYLFLVLILGAGLVVNLLLKDGVGRARPRNVVQFGGVQQFTPAFVLSGACPTNCSFPSGDTSGAFFSFALVLALSRKRAAIVAAVVYGGLVSFSRIASGAHFLSDTVVSFFVMWIMADALSYFVLMQGRDASDDRVASRATAAELPGTESVLLRHCPTLSRVGAGETSRGTR